jgi:hypothetical protein
LSPSCRRSNGRRSTELCSHLDAANRVSTGQQEGGEQGALEIEAGVKESSEIPFAVFLGKGGDARGQLQLARDAVPAVAFEELGDDRRFMKHGVRAELMVFLERHDETGPLLAE